MVRSCSVVPAAAMTGFRAMCALLQCLGYAVCWRDSLGATIYDTAGRTSHWRLLRDEEVVVQTETAAWDVAVTWSGLLWAVAPQPWPAREHAALTVACLRAVADWVVLPPPARWSRLMRAGECEWPVGLSYPITDAGTHGLVRAIGGRTSPRARGPRRPRVRAGPRGTQGVPGRGPERRRPTILATCRPRGGPGSARDQPSTVPGLHPPTARQRAPARVRGGRGATRLPGGPGDLVPRGGGASEDQPGEGDGPEPRPGDLDLGVEFDADKDNEYLLS